MGLVQAIAGRIQDESTRIEKARAEFNFCSIQPHLTRGCKILDVGAWSCYLGELLSGRMGCEVLSLDVVNANKTNVPFRIFDGKRLPVDSGSFDVVLLLYVLHHAADDEPLLTEANRALRDGGRVLVAEDSVDGLWNRILTVGFHVYLWLATRMSCDGVFRTAREWRERFQNAGYAIKATVLLGHHLGRTLWPNNVLFVLEKKAASQLAASAK